MHGSMDTPRGSRAASRQLVPDAASPLPPTAVRCSLCGTDVDVTDLESHTVACAMRDSVADTHGAGDSPTAMVFHVSGSDGNSTDDSPSPPAHEPGHGGSEHTPTSPRRSKSKRPSLVAAMAAFGLEAHPRTRLSVETAARSPSPPIDTLLDAALSPSYRPVSRRRTRERSFASTGVTPRAGATAADSGPSVPPSTPTGYVRSRGPRRQSAPRLVAPVATRSVPVRSPARAASSSRSSSRQRVGASNSSPRAATGYVRSVSTRLRRRSLAPDAIPEAPTRRSVGQAGTGTSRTRRKVSTGAVGATTARTASPRRPAPAQRRASLPAGASGGASASGRSPVAGRSPSAARAGAQTGRSRSNAGRRGSVSGASATGGERQPWRG